MPIVVKNGDTNDSAVADAVDGGMLDWLGAVGAVTVVEVVEVVAGVTVVAGAVVAGVTVVVVVAGAVAEVVTAVVGAVVDGVTVVTGAVVAGVTVVTGAFAEVVTAVAGAVVAGVESPVKPGPFFVAVPPIGMPAVSASLFRPPGVDDVVAVEVEAAVLADPCWLVQ